MLRSVGNKNVPVEHCLGYQCAYWALSWQLMCLLSTVLATERTTEVVLYCSIVVLCVDFLFPLLCICSFAWCSFFSLYNEQKKGEHQAKFHIGREWNEVTLKTVSYQHVISYMYLHCYVINYRCQSQSYITANRQLASLSWYQDIWDPWPIFSILSWIIFLDSFGFVDEKSGL
jgi:hypothetical protein